MFDLTKELPDSYVIAWDNGVVVSKLETSIKGARAVMPSLVRKVVVSRDTYEEMSLSMAMRHANYISNGNGVAPSVMTVREYLSTYAIYLRKKIGL